MMDIGANGRTTTTIISDSYESFKEEPSLQVMTILL